MTTTPIPWEIPPEARVAYLRLLSAHRALTDSDQTTPCEDHPELWTASHRAARALAATACRDCPILTTCQQYANAADEQWHTWAGQDRTPAPQQLKPGEKRCPDCDRIHTTRYRRCGSCQGKQKRKQRAVKRADQRKQARQPRNTGSRRGRANEQGSQQQ